MAVDTRRPAWIAMLGNQALTAVLCFVLTLFAFKWCYQSPWLYVAYIFFHLSGIYSYAYSQVPIDMRMLGRHDFKKPLFIGLWASFWLGITLIPHLILWLFFPDAEGIFAPLARLWNYAYSFFLYGLENNGVFHVAAVPVCLALPVATSYFAYLLSSKKFSFTEKFFKITHTK